MPTRRRKTKRKTRKVKKKTSTKRVSRFERARLLGSRAIQISMGAKPQVKVTGDMDPIEVALHEFEENKLPLDTRAN